MKLSSKAEYALRALLDLALHHDEGLVQISDVARRTNIPIKYLEQIMLTLKSAGILSSKRGVGGGYSLARPPEDISMGEVLSLLDGSSDSDSCVSVATNACPNQRACSIRSVLIDAREAMARIVDHTSFADLASRSRELEQSANGRVMYYI